MTKFQLHMAPESEPPWWTLWLWNTGHRVVGGQYTKPAIIESLVDTIRSRNYELPYSIHYTTWSEPRQPGGRKILFTVIIL